MLSASTITRTIAKGMQHFRDATKGMQSKKCNHRKAPNETRYTNMHNIGSRKFLFRHHSRRVTFKINDDSGTLSKHNKYLYFNITLWQTMEEYRPRFEDCTSCLTFRMKSSPW